MVNERKTEAIVRKLLQQNGYVDNEHVVIEEQSSDNPKIDKLLKSASKSGDGKGYPEFIISCLHAPEISSLLNARRMLPSTKVETESSTRLLQ